MEFSSLIDDKPTQVDFRIIENTNIDKAISISDIIFICVGTPTKKGSIKVDLSFVYKCAKEILSFTQKKK